MGVLDILKGKEEIQLMSELLTESGLTCVYFDNCFILDQNNIKTEVLKFEIFPHVKFTISTDGVDKILREDQVSLSIITIAYLKLQKIIRDYANQN